ncbi:PREDICTED: lysophospholipid acyltransferase 2-like [Branchiostoma belcheri]|uniref:Lysophospholipid acyltransferase 2-like n=1 Tax=Branchiostoma belcheri TaxID=7741 RepID=A0A6P4YTZ8_BRABE|nr:PREDICTED: lysophospholipid acyltransferase 2-like [Branchiostoma belcheri]
MGILMSPERLEDNQLRVSFVTCQVLALLLSLVFRYVLSAGRVGVTARHVFAVAVGMYMAYFCHRWQVIHFFIQSTVCYVIILSSKPSNMHKYVFIFSMLYLTLCHIYRTYYNFGTYTLDFTGPLMIMTQKVTSLSCALHDGLYRDDSSLSADQRKQAVRRIPSPLEYYSYMFYFVGVLAGPLTYYADFKSWMEGTNLKPLIKIDQQVSDSLNDLSSCKSIFSCFVLFNFYPRFLYIFHLFTPTDDLIIAAPLLTRFGYLHLSIMMARTKYYFAWSLADAVANAAGLGFNGYDENGNPRWDLISNLNILKIEFATNLKMLIDNWNIQTSLWFKRVCYDRAPYQPVMMVYILSAIWHGFYPGYYFTFIGGVVLTPAFRKMRRHLRHHFQGTARLRQLYDVITFMSTHFFLNYHVLPFVLLDWEPTMKFYRSLYFSIHIIVLLVVVLLPHHKPQLHDEAAKTNGTTPVQTDVNGKVRVHTERNGIKTNNNRSENRTGRHQVQNGTIVDGKQSFSLKERITNGMKGWSHNGVRFALNFVEKKES